MNDANTRSAEVPLESWKAIAAYLQREVRTVRRWEHTERLPVHRHRHLTRSTVYTYPSELDAWRAGRRPEPTIAELPVRPFPPVRWAVFAAVLMLALVSAGGGRFTGAAAAEQQPGTISLRQVLKGGEPPAGRVSRDGRFLTDTDWQTGDVVVRDLATGLVRRVTNNAPGDPYGEGAENSVPSPDGRQIAYAWWHRQSDAYQIRVISTEGGQPKTLFLGETGGYVQPCDWSPDGRLVLALISDRPRGPSRLVTIAIEDAAIRTLRTFPDADPDNAAFSPDGRLIAFDAVGGASGNMDIFVIGADGSGMTPVIAHPADDLLMDWFPDGSRLLFRSDRSGRNGLWGVAISDGRPSGDPTLFRSDVGTLVSQFMRKGFTTQGDYYYASFEGSNSDVYVATVDPTTGRSASPLTTLQARFSGINEQAVWSPDGQSIAYLQTRPATTTTSVAVQSLATGQVRNFSVDLSAMWNPAWMPDARSLVIHGRTDAPRRLALFRLDVSTGGLTEMTEPVAPGPEGKGQPAVSPDGQRLFYLVAQGSGGVRAQPVGGNSASEQTIFSGSARTFALSPDGRFLAITPPAGSQNPTVPHVRIVPVGGGEPRALVDPSIAEDNRTIAWSADGQHVFFVRETDHGDELWRVAVSSGQPVNTGVVVGGRIARISAHPDGRRLALSVMRNAEAEVWALGGLPAGGR